MNNSADSLSLHEAWCKHFVSKKLGVQVVAPPLPAEAEKAARDAVKERCAQTAHTSHPIKSTRALRRSARLEAALATPDAAAGMIDELLVEARRYVTTVRWLLRPLPHSPEPYPPHVREWIRDVPPAMRIKIIPLCDVAELIGGRSVGSRFRDSYKALEEDFKRRGRAASRLYHGHGAACRKVFDDFKHGVEAWCADYESWMISIGGL